MFTADQVVLSNLLIFKKAGIPAQVVLLPASKA